MSRRVLPAASGAAQLTSMAAAVAAEGDAQAHGVAGRASPRHAACLPRHEQPGLPDGEPMHTAGDGPKVGALAIGDGPSPVCTPQVLRILSRYGITASFSVTGRNAAAFPGSRERRRRPVTSSSAAPVHHCNLRYMHAVAGRDEISRAAGAINAAAGNAPARSGALRARPAAVCSQCAQAGPTPLAWPAGPRDGRRVTTRKTTP